MGEWNRARQTRQSIHDAANPEEREQAIDAMWKLARSTVMDDAVNAVDTVLMTQEDALVNHPHELMLVKMVGEFIKHEIMRVT